MSRQKNPEHLRLVDKTNAHRYKDTEDIKASSDRPVPPMFMSERARQIFEEFVDKLEELGIASATDSDIIELYANNQEQLESYEYFLRIQGSVYESHTINGVTYKQRPEVTMLSACKQLKLKILTEFGLTPASRTRCKLPKKTAAVENPFANLGKAKNG